MHISPYIREAFSLALHEDLSFGDITSELTIDEELQVHALLLAKQSLVVCGLPFMDTLIQSAHADIRCSAQAHDGDWARPGDVIARFEGNARSLLALERTILNVVQRLCSIATTTRNITQRLHSLTVLDTRKTAPGFRLLDKYAVKIGGGRNHRASLGEMVLIKNNHVDCQSGASRAERMHQALRKVAAGKPPYMSFEVEVRDFDELSVALQYQPTVIMLDNFSVEILPEALRIIHAASPSPMVEVSGGITPERCLMLEELGVEFVSMGSLTHSIEAVDVSLRIERI